MWLSLQYVDLPTTGPSHDPQVDGDENDDEGWGWL